MPQMKKAGVFPLPFKEHHPNSEMLSRDQTCRQRCFYLRRLMRA
jgi:hypothetical protein